MESSAPEQREFVSTGECDKCCKRFGKSQTKPFNTYLDVGLTSNRPKSQTHRSGFRELLCTVEMQQKGACLSLNSV